MQTQTIRESDKQLQEAVFRHLEWEPEVVSTDLHVAAKDGIVTLTGFVHTYAEKFAVEKAAKSVYGVKAVANDIEVKPGTNRSDPEIARDVVHAMQVNVAVPDEKIKVTARGGFLTLEGTVEWQYQRRAAENCARNVAGVRGVTNLVEVKPKMAAVSPNESRRPYHGRSLEHFNTKARPSR
ncbi:MAG: BON domain-containing protein [Acidobacteriaceae bacterium]|nr:BON domain-containing protein [Acidobacteriaceae bacterium]